MFRSLYKIKSLWSWSPDRNSTSTHIIKIRFWRVFSIMFSSLSFCYMYRRFFSVSILFQIIINGSIIIRIFTFLAIIFINFGVDLLKVNGISHHNHLLPFILYATTKKFSHYFSFPIHHPLSSRGSCSSHIWILKIILHSKEEILLHSMIWLQDIHSFFNSQISISEILMP